MFKFINKDKQATFELTVEDEGLTHMAVADWFNNFLRGCGYVYKGDYTLLTPEDQQALSQYYREKDRDAFIQSAFNDTENENESSTFPVV